MSYFKDNLYIFLSVTGTLSIARIKDLHVSKTMFLFYIRQEMAHMAKIERKYMYVIYMYMYVKKLVGTFIQSVLTLAIENTLHCINILYGQTSSYKT